MSSHNGPADAWPLNQRRVYVLRISDILRYQVHCLSPKRGG